MNEQLLPSSTDGAAQTTRLAAALHQKIAQKTAHISVIGLSYVGLPLAVEFADAGYWVTGVDLDTSKVAAIGAGHSYIDDIPSDLVARLSQSGHLRATTDYASIAPVPDVVFLCVQTPYTTMKVPDVSFISRAAQAVAGRLVPGQLIILESTTYPGTTEELMRPVLEETGLRADGDFFLAFSPERIDPGRTYDVQTTPKVVGGLTPDASALAAQLFNSVTPGIAHIVSSPRAAEMTKLLENTFRSVNIALVNEFALLSERMDIDIWEVIDAAATKPFGFMRFSPGPGVGGHCIPVDPYYLSWKAREYDFATRFIDLAAQTNEAMPVHVVDLAIAALGRIGKALHGARVLVLGVAFKRDIDDARNSPAQRVIELLRAQGASVTYHDPYVPHFRVAPRPFGGGYPADNAIVLDSQPLTDDLLAASDLVIITTGHTVVDYERVVSSVPAVVDTVNVTRRLSAAQRGTIVRLGAARPT